ncbi:MAG: hypothetical protein ACC613_12030 [Synergistales bacterium]
MHIKTNINYDNIPMRIHLFKKNTAKQFPLTKEQSIVMTFKKPEFSKIAARAEKNRSTRYAWRAIERIFGNIFSEEKIIPVAFLCPLTFNAKCLNGYNDENSKMLLGAIWSIGSWLENKSSLWMNGGHPAEGLFLDVVGSLCLIEMKRSLIDQIRRFFCQPQGWSIVQEWSPGRDSAPIGLQRAIFEDVIQSHEDLPLKINPDNTLKPWKSCSAILSLGEGEEKCLDPDIPCPDCPGETCLYFHIGGCHLLSTKKPF